MECVHFCGFRACLTVTKWSVDGSFYSVLTVRVFIKIANGYHIIEIQKLMVMSFCECWSSK